MSFVWTRAAALLLAAAFAGAAAGAQTTAADNDLTIVATRLLPGESIKLDGTLVHPAWQRAPVFSRFVEKNPVNGAAPSQTTRVQVLFDDKAIYVGVQADDNTPELIRDNVVRYDGVNRTQDFVVVYIDAIGQRSAAQFFRVNAAGSMADGIHTASDDSEDFAPDFDWDAAVARQAGAWTAVLRLPFASLRFAEGRQDWRIMVARRLPRQQFHLFTSVLIPDEAASFIAALQPLAGVQLPERHSFITLRPGLTLRRTRSGSQSKNDADASLDVKWRPRAELVVDGTLNPDFSQVALDVPQLAGNSRFALFLSEKRPFFFESADLLRTPTEALYTRSFTQPRAGLRATWRSSEWAGTAFAIRDRGRGAVLLPGAYGTGIAEQPAFDSLALRAKSERATLSFGGLAAARRYEQGRGGNDVLGPDLGWQISDEWRLRAQWLHSRTDALADNNGQLQRADAVSGNQARLRLQRQSGNGETNLLLDEVSEGFRHDSGFVNQAGIRRVALFQSYGWRGGVGPFNELFFNVDSSQVRDRRSGEVVQEVIRPGLWSSAARNLEWWLEYFARSNLRTTRGAPLLAERFWASGLTMTPATWFPLLESSVEWGRLADTGAGPASPDGTPQGQIKPGVRLNITAKLRPLRALELEPRLNTAWLKSDGQRSYEETAQQWLAVWHFDARHSLRLIAQRSQLDRAGEPSSRSQVESLTYAWRLSAGTRLYLGATRSRVAQGGPASSEAFLKMELDADDVRGWVQ